MTPYKAPLKEFSFILDHLINYSEHCQMPGFEDASRDVVDAVIYEAAKFYEQVIAPTNFSADQQGTHLRENSVVTATALDDAYEKMVEGGWICLNGGLEYGGAGLPSVIDLVNTEMLNSSNMSLGLLPMLSRAAIHALNFFGTPEQKSLYLEKLITGVWSGTMNLTESHAGSDLSGLNTKAKRHGDHFLIYGQKIYITWGDHELSENVVHLVLARIEGAPDGNNGISLFLVPKYIVNADGTLGARNDVRAVGLEHKLGIHASPTCTMAFGDNGGAEGYLVGRENQGLMCMFAMMNSARLSVGHQGVSVGERAYQQAVAHALERVQGRVAGKEDGAAIIKHPDVKRMLMQMRAINEGGRALSFFAIAADDRSNHHPELDRRKQDALLVDILTPLVKGWCTEMSMEVTSLGVQVHGGMGFVEETGAAQYMRDSRILPIYEGTNGIQALDFIGRKCLRDGGEGLSKLLTALDDSVESIDLEDKIIADLGSNLRNSGAQCREAMSHVISNPDHATTVAHPYLMIFGNTICYWLLCKLAFAAHQNMKDDTNECFYSQKIATAHFFASHILSRNEGLLQAITGGFSSLGLAGESYFNQG